MMIMTNKWFAFQLRSSYHTTVKLAQAESLPTRQDSPTYATSELCSVSPRPPRVLETFWRRGHCAIDTYGAENIGEQKSSAHTECQIRPSCTLFESMKLVGCKIFHLCY